MPTPDTVPVEQSVGSCVLCVRRDPHHGDVCDACRSWLLGLLVDLRILHEQATITPPPARDGTDWPALDRNLPGEPGEWQNRQPAPLMRNGFPVMARNLEASPIPGQPAGPRANSKPASRPPIPLDPIDLTAAARPGSRAPHARGQLGLDPDQAGHLSLATTLETWVRDWILLRARGENRPEPTVKTMTRWLADRTDWACDEHPAIDEFTTDLQAYRSALRGILGLIDVPEYKRGVACPKCDERTLYRRNGCEYIECGTCPAMLTPDEYDTTVEIGADGARRLLFWALVLTPPTPEATPTDDSPADA